MTCRLNFKRTSEIDFTNLKLNQKSTKQEIIQN